jgi:hypothetical protein
MNRKKFLDRQYNISFHAGMNQRYHQRYATFWWRCDTWAKIITAVLAVAGAMLSVGALFEGHDPRIDYLALSVASLAAIAAVILNVVPFGAWESASRDLFRQWTDLREDSEELLFACPGEPDGHNIHDLRKLDARLHRLCGAEPSPNKAILQECHDDEKKSRSKPKETQPASALPQTTPTPEQEPQAAV